MADRKQRGPLYCRPELRGQPKKQRTNPTYCPECGLRIRSTVEAHNEGQQHKNRVAKLAKEMRLDASKTKPTIYK